MNCYRPIIDSCVFEGVNVTLPKGQRRVNGFMQQQGLEESFFSPHLRGQGGEENEKVMKSGVGRILAGKPFRHAVELYNMQVFARGGVCECVSGGGVSEIEKGRERQVMI